MMRSQSVPGVTKVATTEKENRHPQYEPVLQQQRQKVYHESNNAEPQKYRRI